MSNDIKTTVTPTKAFTPRPDIDSSSMYGYEAGSAVFKPAAEAAGTPATPSHDVDSSSMRGYTSTGPVSNPS